MRTVAIDLDAASTMELVDAASAIAAKLAERTPPESAAAYFELTEKLARATNPQEMSIAGFGAVVDNSGEAQRWGLPSTRAWLRSRLGMREAPPRNASPWPGTTVVSPRSAPSGPPGICRTATPPPS